MAKRKKYYVVGGLYTKDWAEIVEETREKLGPFNKKKAREVWNGRAWATIDIFSYRFRIYEEAKLPAEWDDL